MYCLWDMNNAPDIDLKKRKKKQTLSGKRGSKPNLDVFNTLVYKLFLKI